MFVQIKRPLSQDETRQLRDLLVEHRLAPQACRDLAFALITFESLAAYEAYRARLRQDAEGMANFHFAEEHRFILAEERTFLRKVVL